EVYGQWHSNITGYANYLRIIASGTREDVFDQIERERSRPTFQITQPTWCRALFMTMANYTNASRMLNSFQHVRKMKPYLRDLVMSALKRIVDEVPDRTSPAIHRQAK